ncbi:MAG: [Fe-Fe] hydrogenase large subunit C-terminal domain-containing protein [Bacteroidota bacterium]|nr:[Fe-Fe] hydrogenase large subunit C-terminal domain-containing protein [Bacteroidota bacterium]
MTKANQSGEIFHAIHFRADMCIGCSHCMNICPVEAIRVREGKARLIPNRCVDCGECYRVCPVGAIAVEQNDFEEIFRFPIRIALIPSVFFGQFPETISREEIVHSIMDLGFTHVHEVEEGAGFLNRLYIEYRKNNPNNRPLISPFCPAIVRLIEVKFPTLLDNIILLKNPMEITAMKARKDLTEKGYKDTEIGIFYVSPCAAKIVAIKSPVGEKDSSVSGVINLNYLYNKTFRLIRNLKKAHGPLPGPNFSSQEICWSLTHGETDLAESGRNLAIDDIKNVIEFLEKLENEEIKGIDFLELRACDESCAGGILCPANRFLTAEKMKKRVQNTLSEGKEEKKIEYTPEMEKFLRDHISLEKLTPRPILKLDDNVAEAVVKMKRMYELNGFLPQVDCGICGSPSCKALAEDIVQHTAELKQCIFIQKIMEQNEKLDIQESVNIMRKIWSESKLDKNSLRDEI